LRAQNRPWRRQSRIPTPLMRPVISSMYRAVYGAAQFQALQQNERKAAEAERAMDLCA
jgi:hypothetical protein